MTESARRIRWSHFARWTLDRLGFATNWRMNHLLRELLLCSTFEELAMPLAVVASDIVTGEAVVFPSVSHNLKLVTWPTDPGFAGPIAQPVADKLKGWLVPALGA